MVVTTMSQVDRLRSLVAASASIFMDPLARRSPKTYRLAQELWSELEAELSDAERDLAICKVCGSEWTKTEYNEMRHVDASDGWCPSCGESGDVEVE